MYYAHCSDPWVFLEWEWKKCDDPAVIFLSLSGPRYTEDSALRQLGASAVGGVGLSEATEKAPITPPLYQPLVLSLPFTIPALPHGSFFTAPTRLNDTSVKVSYSKCHTVCKKLKMLSNSETRMHRALAEAWTHAMAEEH
jgi:hypothetical protein